MVNIINKRKTKQQSDFMYECYERAQFLMQGIWTDRVVLNSNVVPTWIGDGEFFWYKRQTQIGHIYLLVNTRLMSVSPLFDHYKFADKFGKILDVEIDPDCIPIKNIDVEIMPFKLSFDAYGKSWVYQAESISVCRQRDRRGGVTSPDSQYEVVARDMNLWLFNSNTGGESELTTDGDDNYTYGAVGTAWGVEITDSAELQVLWSSDSKKVFTVCRDTRCVRPLPVVHHVPTDGSTRPILDEIRVSYPGDDVVETLQLLCIDIDTGDVTTAKYPKIPVTRNGCGFISAGLGWWDSKNQEVFFVDISKDYKLAKIVGLDASNGQTRVVFEESAVTQINLSLNADELPTYMPLVETDEILWFSERTGWGHLYLYDLKSGELKNTVTSGNWLVRDLLHYDPVRREVYIQTAGRSETVRDPYYRDLARVHIDTGEITTLVSGNYENIVFSPKSHTAMLMNFDAYSGCDVSANSSGVSPNGEFAVVTQSRADTIPTSFLIDRFGEIKMELDKADVSRLPKGWVWPEPVTLLAADDATEIFGLVFRPSTFSPDKSYPVVDHILSSPDMPWVSKGSFSNGIGIDWSYLSAAALAELGFIVVQIDGRGGACRDKEFQDTSYGCINSANNIDDHVAGISQLCDRYKYMDINRIGITTHQSDGPGAVLALLKHPDFFKVGVNFSYFDNRLMSSSMRGNKFGDDSTTESHFQPLENYAERLRGKLLIMHGMLNPACPPAGVFRLIQAFQNANKDFDLLLLPNLLNDPCDYLVRRAWDYLVENLLGEIPPNEFKLTTVFGG